MGLFDFLKGNKNEKNTAAGQVDLFAPASGELLPITAVDDPVFSEKMMGDGYAVEPEVGQVYAPVAGKVINVFPTKHAIGIETENGVEVLVHIGIDTVELDGKPFTVHVEEGQTVAGGDLLADVDLAALEAADKGKSVMILLTNMNDLTGFELHEDGQVNHGDIVGKVEKH